VLNPVPHKIRKQQCWLTADRTLFWEEEKALIVSDLHFGKTGHFRKSGIAIPASVYTEDLQRLVLQIQYFQPSQLIIVGDMFHSLANKEMDLFLKWRNDLSGLRIQLIRGNHDILTSQWYARAGIDVSRLCFSRSPFQFIHDISDTQQELPEGEKTGTAISGYSFSGHIHPGIRLHGAGRQSLHFPCFYFRKTYAVLPAFSRFTGISLIRPVTGDEVFAIVDQALIRIQ